MKTERFQKIFESAFDDPEAWRKWFFGCVATDPNQIYLDTDAERASAALLMQPYVFLSQGRKRKSGYMSCIATLPEHRSKGLASKVIKSALRDARSRGYAFCELIPAEDHLYFFYDRLNFATVFYTDCEHYTSLHSFNGGMGAVADTSFALFLGLEMRQGCGVLHSEDDYRNILHDMELDGKAHHIAVLEGLEGAMLFATEKPRAVEVKCLLADDEKYAVAALAELRRRVGEKTITVKRPPVSGNPALLRSYGMERLTSPMTVLSALAGNHRELRLTIRLHDAELPENTGVYTIRRGECTFEEWHEGKFDLDVTPAVLASILFSSNKAGEIFNIPTRRPYMALMLD